MTPRSVPAPKLLIGLVVGFLLGGMVMGGLLSDLPPAVGTGQAATSPRVRDYEMNITAADFQMGEGATWHAWTFDGSIPGPTIMATEGDIVRVKVNNRHNLTHSFHTHLSPYTLENDGSQLNTITGIGGMAMIPPGESYTYTFEADLPGIFYYHCHSADGNHTISKHIGQGLYGAIIVRAREEIPVRDHTLFMAERGHDVSGDGAPYYLMNGRGIPGGEHKLMEVYDEEGVEGVTNLLGTTVPIIKGKVGEPVRIAVINIGDQIHSFHLHAMTAYSVDQNPGRPVPAQVVQLVPGGADRIIVTPTQPGLWLFHCHVVSHADAGMIGVFIVEPEDAESQPWDPDAGAAHGTIREAGAPPAKATPGRGGHGDGGHDAGSAGTVTVKAGADGQELRFAPEDITAKPGDLTVAFENVGMAPHTLTFPTLGADTGTIASGGKKTLKLDDLKAGTYDFECTVPGHKQAGMVGTLKVVA